ncbi:MAG: acyl-ACP--UDP-N-acetylglucosamine O-acyltransferase [Rhodobacteraceae bacterium]|nr:acyl-ACP--UDP-N-acetylglucosamine O-acyltransferase [Paracoccaceae bacterium]TVR46868.1 MAG: acyl-ACP--UDP-N-acetylglucosamine O-acyltransferase [Paracoccaceae bacterium]
MIDPSAEIHPSAIVEPGAQIGPGCTIGPFAIIGPEVTLGADVTIRPHALVTGWTEIGPDCTVFSFASVGEVPQDLKYAGERTRLIIGAGCRIRENATLHIGTHGGGGVTRVGDNVLVMAGAHVAHDAQVGDNVILAQNAAVAGHVTIEKDVIVGAAAGLHQHIRVGEGAMIGAMTRVIHDVMPFGLVSAPDGELQGLNLIGLKRRGMERAQIAALRAAYKRLASDEGALSDLAQALLDEGADSAVAQVARFFTDESGRNFLRPK